jgi:hypothetical protein
MTIEFGLTDGSVNTQYAPLAALSAHYQQNLTLRPLREVQIPIKERAFSPPDKLIQVLLSILAGCVTLSEVNLRLRPEVGLAKIWHWDRFADQSCLSRTLDALTLKQIDQLRCATTSIWRPHSLTLRHDWRGYLWLDFDLSGLPCGKHAQESQKGYFSGKKTSLDANWPGSAPFATVKPSGPTCSLAINIPCIACDRPYAPPKML